MKGRFGRGDAFGRVGSAETRGDERGMSAIKYDLLLYVCLRGGCKVAKDAAVVRIVVNGEAMDCGHEELEKGLAKNDAMYIIPRVLSEPLITSDRAACPFIDVCCPLTAAIHNATKIINGLDHQGVYMMYAPIDRWL